MKDVLESDRLILRRWTDDDAENLYKLASVPEVGKGAGWPAHSDVKYSLAVIRSIFAADGEYAITFKDNISEPIGSIGISAGAIPKRGIMREDEAEVGYWVGRNLWNRGIATEALNAVIEYGFREVGFSKIWCGYFDGNESSKHVMEKCGMIKHHRNEHLYNAMLKEYYNETMMCIGLNEYILMKKKKGND